ncbi:MAG: hypothetical protein MUP36_03015, partial [Demequinaceae bacterium]|nr:hypothetical protein [Demequinaceae bacterium]
MTLDEHSDALGEEAIDTLETALRTGVLTRDQVDDAAAVTADCMEDAGLIPMFNRPEDDFTGYTISFTFDVGDERDDAKAEEFGQLGEACLARHFDPVETFYLSQPVAIEAQEVLDDALFETIRDDLFTCLSTTSYRVDRNARKEEMYEMAIADFMDRNEDSCYKTTGLMGL